MTDVLVIGGKGFIGGRLCSELKATGIEPRVYDLPENDVRDARRLREAIAGCHLVYHLGGMLGSHELNTAPVEATLVNVIGTLNVLDAALMHGAKVVFISKPNVWLNTYSITKAAAEDFCRMYQTEFGLRTVIAKPFNVYGEAQRIIGYRKAVPYMILEALQERPITIYGDGEQTVDLIYVGDVVRALLAAGNLEEAVGQSFEIGSGEEMTVNELARFIIELTKSRSTLNHVPMRSGETLGTRLKADTSRMEHVLGIKPNTDHVQPMLRTIDWYRSFAKSVAL